MTTLSILLIVFAYLLGSINSAILVCRGFRLPDPRLNGSCNPGATNVLRVGGRVPALLVLAFDVLKGTVPVWSGYFMGLSPFSLGWVAIAACLGHMYPLFFSFQGGKGVATAFGSILPIGLDLSGLLVGIWLLTAKLTRYSSLSAIVAVTAAPLLTWYFKPQYCLAVAMLAVLIIIRHRSNIVRLLRRQENKLGGK